jgi:type 1 glutamine amidotransferase
LKALIVWGGWDGHYPEAVAAIFARLLRAEGFTVDVSDSLDAFKDTDRMRDLQLIVPVWTMGKIAADQLNPLTGAVKNGVAIGGCHGGMCDSFREATEYQFMTGGQWVSHPGNDGVRYTVKITQPDHPITRGIRDFEVSSEQYYMHIDPSNNVLATTRFPTADGPHVPNGEFDMPVAWTRYYGKGRVFYHSLGHKPDVIEQPEVLELTRRGLLWATERL